MEAVAAEHGLRVADLLGPARERRVCEARWHACHALRECEKPLSLMELSRLLDRDHSTIMHGLRQWGRIVAGEPRQPRNQRHRLKSELARCEKRLVMLRAKIAEMGAA
jgi:chromosomal replication initiation ATPase DnaA